MKKRLLVALLSATMLLLTGCSLTYGDGNIETGKNNYMLTRIPNPDVPAGWKTSEYMSFYYDINTHIIYVGKNDLALESNSLYELKSKDYRNYVYENYDFVGVE